MTMFVFDKYDKDDGKLGERMTFPGRDVHDAATAALSYFSISDSTAALREWCIHTAGGYWKPQGETKAAASTIQEVLERMTDASIRNYREVVELRRHRDYEEFCCQICKLVMPFKDLEHDHTSAIAPNRCPKCHSVVYLHTTIEKAHLQNKVNEAGREVSRLDKQLRDQQVELTLLRQVVQASHSREAAQVKFDNIPEGWAFKDELASLINKRISLRDVTLTLRDFYRDHHIEGAPLL